MPPTPTRRYHLHTDATADGELTEDQDTRLKAAAGDVDLTTAEPDDPQAAAFELYWDGDTELSEAGVTALRTWLDARDLHDIGLREQR